MHIPLYGTFAIYFFFWLDFFQCYEVLGVEKGTEISCSSHDATLGELVRQMDAVLGGLGPSAASGARDLAAVPHGHV